MTKQSTREYLKKGPKSGRQQLLSLTHLKFITYWSRWHQCPKYQTPKASSPVPLPVKQDLERFRNQTILYQDRRGFWSFTQFYLFFEFPIIDLVLWFQFILVPNSMKYLVTPKKGYWRWRLSYHVRGEFFRQNWRLL